MAIILTDGFFYVKYTGSFKTKLTMDKSEAYDFGTVPAAIHGIKRAPVKTKGFRIYDTETQTVCHRGEIKQKPVKVASKKQISLKRQYGSALYHQANGRCQLCGRRITFEDSTVDHIIPKAMGGTNDISNLQLSCYPCNQLKGSILPDTFFERVTDIFMYQMEKRYSGRFYWKILSMILRKLKE